MVAGLSRRSVLVALALLGGSCGGSNPTTPPPVAQATPTPTPSATASPSVPTPTPTPTAAARCDNLQPLPGEEKLQPGPVTRVAVSPRQQVSDNQNLDILVRARPGFDEVWCVDKDKEHRLDFNLNQRNDNGKECCWLGFPEWKVDDPGRVVDSAAVRDDFGFIYRLRINTHGERVTVGLSARLDGVDSAPWQSGSGYEKGPLQIVAMGANEITRDCKCIYKGNGIYEGVGCTK